MKSKNQNSTTEFVNQIFCVSLLLIIIIFIVRVSFKIPLYYRGAIITVNIDVPFFNVIGVLQDPRLINLLAIVWH
jgi:uncharacterized membrane protein